MIIIKLREMRCSYRTWPHFRKAFPNKNFSDFLIRVEIMDSVTGVYCSFFIALTLRSIGISSIA